MMLLAFSVRDEAVGAFLPPIFVRSKGEAIRSFSDACLSPEHQFARHLDQYVLYGIGAFDDSGGMFVPSEPSRIISGFEVAGPKD